MELYNIQRLIIINIIVKQIYIALDTHVCVCTCVHTMKILWESTSLICTASFIIHFSTDHSPLDNGMEDFFNNSHC